MHFTRIARLFAVDEDRAKKVCHPRILQEQCLSDYWLIVVRLGRFELSTSCFGGTRSIHLSYSRTIPLYHAVSVDRILNLGGVVFGFGRSLLEKRKTQTSSFRTE